MFHATLTVFARFDSGILAAVSGGNGRRGRRVALPEEFLRLPGWSGGSSATDPQVSADARLAMMLQVGGPAFRLTYGATDR